MKQPEMFGRKMKKVKEYEHHVLFEDEVTGIKKSFQYWDLNHEIINNQVYYYEKGKLIPIDKKPENVVPKKNIKNDNRLNELMEKLKR